MLTRSAGPPVVDEQESDDLEDVTAIFAAAPTPPSESSEIRHTDETPFDELPDLSALFSA
jgi:hypothetical protein